MAADPHLAEQTRAALGRPAGIVEKRMFGGMCWMRRGNMLCGLTSRDDMFRVGPALMAEALRRLGARMMDFTGRPMKGFVLVAPDAAIDAGLEEWIAFSMRFVGTLPPKAAKAITRGGR